MGQGGGGILPLIGWPFAIPVYPIIGGLATFAMAAVHYILHWIGVSEVESYRESRRASSVSQAACGPLMRPVG